LGHESRFAGCKKGRPSTWKIMAKAGVLRFWENPARTAAQKAPAVDGRRIQPADKKRLLSPNNGDLFGGFCYYSNIQWFGIKGRYEISPLPLIMVFFGNESVGFRPVAGS